MSGMKRVYEELIQMEHEIAEIEDDIKKVETTEEASFDRSFKLASMYIELGRRFLKFKELEESLKKGD